MERAGSGESGVRRGEVLAERTRHGRSRWRSSFGRLQKVVAVATLLAFAQGAMAGGPLRRPATAGSASSGLPSIDAAASAQAAASQAAAAAQQVQGRLGQALEAIRVWQARQAAARAAAMTSSSSVPNGLAPGGLQVAIDPNTGNPVLWQGADQPWWQITPEERTAVTVRQNAPQAILQWRSFNVGRETDLRFDQSQGGAHANEWVVLNRVTDTRPSQILGNIKAEGQVYVINRNGILFGGSSQVNVATLVASGLDFAGATLDDRNKRFTNGLLSSTGLAFGGDTLSGQGVTVEAGAQISVAPYGQVALFGEQVTNRGTLKAPDGQVLLAAGRDVYLTRRTDNRGYTAEAGRAGSAVNEGIVSTPRGNITIKGKDIQQNGLLTATTGADANGSIFLGRDYLDSDFNSLAIEPVTVRFGEGSLTQILPDDDGKMVIGTTQFTPSRVDVYGEKIYFLSGASLYVPSGNVTLSTRPATTEHPTEDDPYRVVEDPTRIYVEAGATLDVSGLRDVEVAMEQNQIQAELRADELRDFPVLRNGALRSQRVYFDARLGVSLADFSGYYDLIERDVKQVMTRGGSLSLYANEIITRQGSVIDLSGGSLRYQSGYLRSTQLIDQTGRRVRIEDAVAGVPYLAIDNGFVVDHSRWGVTETYSSGLSRSRPHFESGYVQGSDAGTLTLSNNSLVCVQANCGNYNDGTWPNFDQAATGAYRILDGDVVATTVVGPRQREVPSLSASSATLQQLLTQAWRERPRGAALIDRRSGDVTIADRGPQLDVGFTFDSSLQENPLYQQNAYAQVLPARWFNGNTFSSVQIVSGYTDDSITNSSGSAQRNLAPGGNLVIGQGTVVDLGDGGSFSFIGSQAQINGTLRAPGGTVDIKTLQLPEGRTWGSLTIEERPTIHVTGTIDVAGRWSNELLDGVGTPLRAIDGGSITLAGYNVIVDQNSLVDASGGGRLSAQGAKVTPGKGGTITLDVSQLSSLIVENNGRLERGDGALRGYALETGGTLNIRSGRAVVIGQSGIDEAELPANAYRIDTGFFQRGGFSSYSIFGEQGLTVTAGTKVAPEAETLVLPSNFRDVRSGAVLSSRQVLPADQQNPMQLTFSNATRRQLQTLEPLRIGDGAIVSMVPGSTVNLLSTTGIEVDGTIEADGGSISLTTTTETALSNHPYIRLGHPDQPPEEAARLLANGYVRTRSAGGVPQTSVENGGTVSISVSGNLTIDPSAAISVAGVHADATQMIVPANGPLGRAGYQERPVDGSAGSITIDAATGSIAGILNLRSGGETGYGGLLQVQGSQNGGLVVRQSVSQGPSAGRLTVFVESIQRSGLDDLQLSVFQPSDSDFGNGTVIEFDGAIDLHVRRSLTLVSPQIVRTAGSQGDVHLRSHHVVLQGSARVAYQSSQPVNGNPGGDLLVQADELLDLQDSLWLGCRLSGCATDSFATTTLRSGGDIRLSSSNDANGASGIFSPGALAFQARQVYVTAREQVFGSSGATPLERNPDDPGFLIQAGTSITVGPPPGGAAGSAPVPLSFGERLTMQAPTITIQEGGVVRAPQGQIQLRGTESVTLEGGSLVSVSLEGLTVPFGEVMSDGSFRGYEQSGWVPTKSITIDAPAVAVNSGATVDVSGGGDLLGYRFSPGNGGSTDILGRAGYYAVLPSLGNSPMPVGGAGALRDSSLQVGDSVWLQGVPGLTDGYYTLLPAHYALLPGGLLVQPQSTLYASAPATLVRPDGAIVASGWRTANRSESPSARDQGFRQFVVMSRDVFGKYSEYATYSFNEAAATRDQAAGIVARTPRDAGSVVLSATASLGLEGSGRFGAGDGGLVGNLDIAADQIAVVGQRRTANGYSLWIDAQALSDFGAGSVLLGGTRQATTDGTALTVRASQVLVDTGPDSAWTGQEIILAANNTVTIAEGSQLHAQGITIRDQTPLIVSSGDGALVRLSTGGRVAIVRQNPAGARGDLNVQNASLSTAGSLALDGSRSVVIDPGATLMSSQLDLGSNRVNLGAAPAGTNGTTLGPELLARLASASDLLIRGRESIHLWGDLELGSGSGSTASLQSLTLDTALLQGHAGAGVSARIAAAELTLRNSGDPSGSTGTAGNGSLVLEVGRMVLGPGQLRATGYDQFQGAAAVVEARETGGLDLGGSLSLQTGQLQATSGASYTLSADGDVALIRGANPGAAAGSPGPGGRLQVQGANVLVDTSIVLPAGTFEARATSGDLNLGSSAVVDVRGTAVDFDDQVRFAPGGAIRLSALGGLTIATGATLDVSGSSRGGDAGSMELTAGGQATVLGTLRGVASRDMAGNQYAGGSFALNALRVSDPSVLFAPLDRSGFTSARWIRLRGSQNLTLATGETIQAHEVLLRSDGGAVTVAGQILAAGDEAHPSGGTIEIIGGAGVRLEGTASLDAHAGQAGPEGFDPASGRVELVASGGRLDVAPGAVIDISGGRLGGGVIVARAARVGNDVAIDRLAGNFLGARERVVQGAQTYTASSVDSGLTNGMIGDAATWLSNAGAIWSRLGDFDVAPAMVVSSGGDLTIANDVDLHSLGSSGYLGFAAGQDIVVRGAVSDGFDSAARTAALQATRSFSYRFESGNDIQVAAGVLIRTGTGNISIQAGRDLTLGDKNSVIYTAGMKTPFAGNFTGTALGEFPTQGGDITIRAGRDISAPMASQTTSAWLFRDGDTVWNGQASTSTVAQQTSWSVVYKNFQQGVGALGGGNVTVRAGNDIHQLQVAIPTTGQLTLGTGELLTQADGTLAWDRLVVRGGGDLALSAGGSVYGGLFVLGRGHADLRAGESVLPADSSIRLRTVATGVSSSRDWNVGVLFGLMDATASVTAGASVLVEGAFDPTRQGQIAEDLNGTQGSAFSGYTDRTSLAATSIGGQVTYVNDPWAAVDLSLGGYNPVTMLGAVDATTLNGLYSRAPPSLRLTSLESSVLLQDRFAIMQGASALSSTNLTLAPSGRGALELLAKEDVRLRVKQVSMEDIASSYQRGLLGAYTYSASNDRINAANQTLTIDATNNLRGSTPIHVDDPDPVRIYAIQGSVCADLSGQCVPGMSVRSNSYSTLLLPKPVDVLAGEDVLVGDYQTQNNGPAAISRIRAGRDVIDVGFQLTGEGTGLVEAGRNLVEHAVSLGGSTTTPSLTWGGVILSRGNSSAAEEKSHQVNWALPRDRAADLYVIAGTAAGMDYDAFAAAYLDPANGHGVVETRPYLDLLGVFLKGLGKDLATDAERLAAFGALPEAQREIFLSRIYFNELKQTGIDYNDPSSPRYQSYDRGFRAVSLLFPDVPSYAPSATGNVILGGKSLETRAGGDITVLAPRGRVEVGASLLPKGFSADQGGIVTRRGGDIRIMADQNIDLFTSRVFTLQGGDITMWTSHGSITAGSGSKTSVFSVPLAYTMSNYGIVNVDVFGLATGAGIGVLDALQGSTLLRRSRLDLIAPEGEVNAGDAGIRVVGDLNIAAQVVVGIENIQVSGAAAGVPKVEPPNVAALTSASQVTQAAANEGVGPAAQSAKNTMADLPSIITVEVVGYETTDKDDDSGNPSQRRGKRDGGTGGGSQPANE